MAAMRELNVGHDRVNVLGGACALGHPIGATGARIIVTLLNALDRAGAKRGVASLCIGGGEATAIALERADRKEHTPELQSLMRSSYAGFCSEEKMERRPPGRSAEPTTDITSLMRLT